MMRGWGVSRALGLLVLGVLLVSPRVIFAHAILLRASPAAHSRVHGPHLDVELKFNSRLDGKRSKLVLNAADGHAIALGKLTQTDPSMLVSSADGLLAGHYVLHWIALASDGHITRGEIPFDVE